MNGYPRSRVTNPRARAARPGQRSARSYVILFEALALALMLATPVGGQDRTLEAVETSFTRWMTESGVARGTLAVAHRDRLVLVRGYGGLRGERRVLIASLTKPITSVCTAMLIQQGKLRFDSTLAEWLPKRYGNPRDPRLLKVTVAQLLTHRAGFSRREDDPATGSALWKVLQSHGAGGGTMHDLVPSVLRAHLDFEPGATFVYTNASYLLLGVIIEAVTGESYEHACSAKVLAPHGIRDARLDTTWAVLGSFGGWSLSAPEYLAFLRTFAPGSPILAPETRRWMLSAAGKETTASGPLFYSLIRVSPAAAGGYDFQHTGSFGYRWPDKRVDENGGNLAVSANFGASWVVHYEPWSSAAATALAREMYQAMQGVTVWPTTDLYPSLNLR